MTVAIVVYKSLIPVVCRMLTKIFSLFFLLLFFFACTQQQNDSEVVLAASPEQTLDLDGEILPIQELIPMSICRLDTFLVILNMDE